MRILFVWAITAGLALPAEQYLLGPDSQVQPGVPKGTVTAHVLPPGKYSPGTPHNYSIYVPAQYDASKPAPFMIFLDGSGALSNNVRVPVVFDNLIAKRELPPMIGIFVNPGVLPPENRFERVFEYDSLSDRFSSFLIDELIPAVGAKYNLSKDPNDRGISGVSTGAVGAFAAAWNRPDQFRRVLSFIGTFVAMKGADGLPALIRRTEPKPIRIFLQAGKNDHVVPNQPQGTFYAGSWPINNHVMYEAFQFAGYDANFVLGDEGHNMKHGAAIMPDALRWLWRPEPIVVKEPAAFEKEGWDPRGKVYSTVWASKGWEQVQGPNTAAADAGKTASGSAYAVNGKTVVLRDKAGKTRVVYQGSDLAQPGGVALSPDQTMLVVTDAQSRFSWSFQIAPDGSLRYGEPFYRLEMPESGWMSGVRGAAFDSIGQVYFATPLGVQVCEANGRVAMILNPPERGAVTQVAFGGKEMNWLYVTVNGKTYRRETKVNGVPASVVAKLPRPPL
ncbi:MAG: SMP-30/gluconolactonase/LRE family protein [Acidobacteria bacterium]|nr:SMP-30/gluconolactonase/LRE family protein [Acidobacteriota bacterium]